MYELSRPVHIHEEAALEENHDKLAHPTHVVAHVVTYVQTSLKQSHLSIKLGKKYKQ